MLPTKRANLILIAVGQERIHKLARPLHHSFGF